MMSDLINGLQNSMNKRMADSNNLPNVFLQMQKVYQNFVKQMEKSDFCNTPRRYIVELGYAKQLSNLADKYKIPVESEKWSSKIVEIEQKLADFGVKIND